MENSTKTHEHDFSNTVGCETVVCRICNLPKSEYEAQLAESLEAGKAKADKAKADKAKADKAKAGKAKADKAKADKAKAAKKS